MKDSNYSKQNKINDDLLCFEFMKMSYLKVVLFLKGFGSLSLDNPFFTAI